MLLQLGGDEFPPGLPVAGALVSQVNVIRADHITGGQQPELGAQDVPRPPAAGRIPAAPLKQRAGEQLAGCRCDRLLGPHASDQNHIGALAPPRLRPPSAQQYLLIVIDRRLPRLSRPDIQAVIDAPQQRAARAQRVVLRPVRGVRGRRLNVSRQRRLVDLRMMPAEPAGNLAPAERLIKLADALLQHRPHRHDLQCRPPSRAWPAIPRDYLGEAPVGRLPSPCGWSDLARDEHRDSGELRTHADVSWSECSCGECSCFGPHDPSLARSLILLSERVLLSV